MRTLGTGSWHAADFDLRHTDVHYPNHDRGGRVRVLGDGSVLVTADEHQIVGLRAAVDYRPRDGRAQGAGF